MSEQSKKPTKLSKDKKLIAELTDAIQHQRADFENYRKNTEAQIANAKQLGEISAITKILPVIDNIDRATNNLPSELENNSWAQGIISLRQNLEKILTNLNLTKIVASPGTEFNPKLHHAVAFEDGESDTEIISEELQSGYIYKDQVLREAMVKVKK